MRHTKIVAALAATAACLAAAPAAGARMQVSSSGGGTARQVTSAAMDGGSPTSALAADVLAARQATARFATGLNAAKAAGYRIITPMMPNMGYHYMNPAVTGFNVRRPPILVYEHTPEGWRLGALEWVFTSKPARAPFPGARYGTFPAACHYVDGTFVPAGSQTDCGSRSPKTGARFLFWHPRLVTLHVWVWYPNPAGIYNSTNPLVAPFNHG
jgi:hypothetical protein